MRDVKVTSTSKKETKESWTLQGMFQNKEKQSSNYETEKNLKLAGMVVFSGIINFFIWKYFLVPFETFPFAFMRFSRPWTIGMAVFLFFSTIGMWNVMDDRINFYRRGNKRLAELEEQKPDNLSQIQKLKELKDSGAITLKEYNTKKKRLLEE